MNEVYIDGVNVAECEFYTNLKMDCSLMPLQNLACSKNPNCYYKQLQRAKAEKQEKVLKMAEAEVEIEKLQAENEHIKESYNSISDSFMKLRNEEWDCYYVASTIKSIFEGARGATEEALKQTTLEKVMYYVRIADMYLHFHEDVTKREIKEKNNKYKQALENIREDLNNSCWESADIGIRNRILNKINEVLND